MLDVLPKKNGAIVNKMAWHSGKDVKEPKERLHHLLKVPGDYMCTSPYVEELQSSIDI